MSKWCFVAKLWPCSDVLIKRRSLNILKWCSKAKLWPFLAILLKKMGHWIPQNSSMRLKSALFRCQNKYRFWKYQNGAQCWLSLDIQIKKIYSSNISKWYSEAKHWPFSDIWTKNLILKYLKMLL